MRHRLLLPAALALLWAFGATARGQTMASTRLADGFDFPVGKPNGDGYYKFRGYRPSGHLGEDWNGLAGGNSDLGDPVYSIGIGLVVLARDARMGWGNVVIVRHSFYENGRIQHVDSLYAHLHAITVREGQLVGRGQQVGTIGTNRGMYTAHLHLEIRKNLQIGTNCSAFGRGYDNYYDPTKFIAVRRSLPGGGRSTTVPINTFSLPHGGPAKPGGKSTPSGNGFRIDRYGDVFLNQRR